MKNFAWILAVFILVGCDDSDSDTRQKEAQERILAESVSEVGLPAIHNFREKRILKDILEMRDREILTYTYLFSEMSGKLSFFCTSVGYGIPYATQYTNPQKDFKGNSTMVTLPQADPNGLFSPSSASGTWILCKDPTNDDGTKPIYVEPTIVVSPFKLDVDQQGTRQ